MIYLLNSKTKIKSDLKTISGIAYDVSDYPDNESAANILFSMNKYAVSILQTLKKDVMNDYDFGHHAYFVDNIIELFDPTVLAENPPVNDDTAYIIGKNSEFKLCIRDRDGNLINDMSLIKFVVLHELSHVGSKEYDHGAEFWGNFAWFLRYLESRNLYSPIDYSKYPQTYCGLYLDYNPYYYHEKLEQKFIKALGIKAPPSK